MQVDLFADTRRQLSLRSAELEKRRSLNAETRYSELARAIKQKEDTLYVVAMQVIVFFLKMFIFRAIYAQFCQILLFHFLASKFLGQHTEPCWLVGWTYYSSTLYIFCSFFQDYYLLPAVNRNSTDRPRISLILPAFSYNGTLPNQVSCRL